MSRQTADLSSHSPLIIDAFFDSRVGHQKQTEAVLAALGQLTVVEIRRKQVSKLGVIERLQNYGRFFTSGKSNTGNHLGPNIIMGSGSRCHLPMLLAGQQAKPAKIVTCMTPEGLLIKKFDLCLVPRHDSPPKAENIFLTNGPPCPLGNKDRHNSKNGLILVGGIDHKSHHWQSAATIKQIKEVICKTPVIDWTISSSPRTPQETVLLLEMIADDSKNVEFYRAEDTARGWIEEQYHRSRQVWVTADSISMVYEALSAGCQVGILPVNWLKKNNKFQAGLDLLAAEDMIIPYKKWQNGAPFSKKAAEFHEAKRCAEEILRRWWPNRLP